MRASLNQATQTVNLAFMASAIVLQAVDFALDELIPEKDVPEKFPGIFAVDELPELRRQRKIGCFRLSAQRILYREADIKDYVRQFYQRAQLQGDEPCRDDTTLCSSTETIGLPKSPGAQGSTDIGLRADESAAASLLLWSSTGPSAPRPSSLPSPSDGRFRRGVQKR
jgi:hypothetical protein